MGISFKQLVTTRRKLRYKLGRKSKIDTQNTKAIPVYFPKNNNLISSKSQMTLNGRKIFDAAIMNVKEMRDEDGDNIVCAELSGQELREFLGSSSGSLYERVKELLKPERPKRQDGTPSPTLLDWRIVMYDDEQKKIQASSVITDAKFENGRMKIIFNKKLKKKLIGYQKNFTMLDRTIVSKFTSNYSYQLYQIFKQTIDYQRSITKEEGPFELQVDLVDLKVQLGVVSANENKILYEAVTDDTVISYEAIEEMEDKVLLKSLREYGNFRRYAIELAKKEINELSDINMDYTGILKGKGGRGVGFKFKIEYKDKKNSQVEKKQKEDLDIFDFIDEMRSFIKGDFSSKDLKTIAEAADYDLQKIKQAYDAMTAVQGGVNNPTGFMIRAIKEGYKASKPRKSAATFNNFQQIEHDFDALEEQLLDN